MMTRVTRALLLCGILAACGDESPTPVPATSTPAASPTKAEVKVPTTGVPQIQGGHDRVKDEIRLLEKRRADGKPLNPDSVRGQIGMVAQLLLAAELAIEAEAMQQHRTRVGKLRQQLQLYREQDAELSNEIREIRKMIDSAKKGVDQLPEGYTETELLDRAGELEVKLQRVQKDEKEHRVVLAEQEGLLRKETPPPLGDSILTRELVSLQETRARLEKLLK